MPTSAVHRIALLALSDGSVFYGRSIGYGGENGEQVCRSGEVVFNTAISGYQEILTDPSYHSQIINFTYPHIGNVGANILDEEGERIMAAGIVARRVCTHYSNWRAAQSLPDYLFQHKIVALHEVDTRAITRRLRDKGALGGCLMVVGDGQDVKTAAKEAVDAARAAGGLDGVMLADDASGKQAVEWQQGEWQQADNAYAAAGSAKRRVTVLDCGVKKNILRALTQRGCDVHVLPYESDYETVIASRPDGVLISNGPGDPAPCTNARTLVERLLADKIPLFGLCLGHQIIAAALGAKTEKMKFGHHGANHPVQAQDGGYVMITSQNHSFAVRAETLPVQVRVTYRSLFDGTLQGFAGDSPPLMTFQGHPEASPGPQDAAVLFNQFMQLIDKCKDNA